MNDTNDDTFEQTATIIEVDTAQAQQLGVEVGFYFRDDDYPDEGWAGPYPTIDDAIQAVTEAGYIAQIPWS